MINQLLFMMKLSSMSIFLKIQSTLMIMYPQEGLTKFYNLIIVNGFHIGFHGVRNHVVELVPVMICCLQFTCLSHYETTLVHYDFSINLCGSIVRLDHILTTGVGIRGLVADIISRTCFWVYIHRIQDSVNLNKLLLSFHSIISEESFLMKFP